MDQKYKNYETYYRSARVQVFKNFLTILNDFDVFWTISNHYLGLSQFISVHLSPSRSFDDYHGLRFSGYLCVYGAKPDFSSNFGLSRFVSVYLGLSRSILVYLGLSRSISVYLSLSWSILVYLSISQSISVYLGLSWSFLVYLGLYQTISDYLGLSRPISAYLSLSRPISA